MAKLVPITQTSAEVTSDEGEVWGTVRLQKNGLIEARTKSGSTFLFEQMSDALSWLRPVEEEKVAQTRFDLLEVD